MPTFKFIFWIFFPIATIYCQSIEEKLNQKLKINGMWGDYYSIDNDSSFHLVKGNVHLDSLYFLSENDINNFFCTNYLNRYYIQKEEIKQAMSTKRF